MQAYVHEHNMNTSVHKQASRAGADVMANVPEDSDHKFRYPSYVEDIMGM